jgi:hypothetical protein
MPRISLDQANNVGRTPTDQGTVQKLINLTAATWHAAFPGGAGAIAVTTGFTNPSAAEADRIPEVALTAGGTPGAYIIVGTWNSAAQTETITTVAGDTVKGTKPFDTVTSFSGPDPGPAKNVTLYAGDSYADPPARALWTGSAAGNAAVQLLGETAVKTIALPAYRDWPRRVVRVAHSGSGTTLTAPYMVW